MVNALVLHQGHEIRATPVRVYPYYESLRNPLYGKDRPVWKMPEAFTEAVEHAVWKFLESKKLCKTINEQMSQHFCSVNLEKPAATLSPLPNFLKQPGLTQERVAAWQSAAQRAFHQLVSQYGTFKCPMNEPAWREAEPDVRSAAREDALLLMDASTENLTVVGRVEDLKRIKDGVTKVAATAMRQVQRKRDEESETMEVAPTLFYILEQEGLQRVHSMTPDLKMSYNDKSRKLSFIGIPNEIYKVKSWILEKKFSLVKKQIEVSPVIFDFLLMVDSEEMSQKLFTSRGTCASYSINDRVLSLVGTSDSTLADAENKMRAAFESQTIDVDDPEVLHLPEWMSLKNSFLEHNSSMTRVAILHRGDQITVVGFQDLVRDVSCRVKPFIVDNSRVKETIRLQSCALQFMVKKKKQDYTRIAEACSTQIQIDEARPSFSISGPRYCVVKARSLIQEMVSTLSTDKLIMNNPGAKKFFQLQATNLMAIVDKQNCVITFGPEREEQRSLCKFPTPSGVQLSVSEADICLLHVDAVVNAANEDLHHGGGLAAVLLAAAGPELQNICNSHVTSHGPLRPGDVVATDACNLPCKHVIHAVGPRFSNHSRDESVRLLKRVVTQSVKEAERLKCSSVAIPAISSGAFDFPLDLCADTIAQAVWEHCRATGGQRSLREIQLVSNNDKTAEALATAIKKVCETPGRAVARAAPAASR